MNLDPLVEQLLILGICIVIVVFIISITFLPESYEDLPEDCDAEDCDEFDDD